MIVTPSSAEHSSKYALVFLEALVDGEAPISQMSAHVGHHAVEALDSIIDDDGQSVADELVNDDLNVVAIYDTYPDLQGDVCLFVDFAVVVAAAVVHSPVE